MIKSKHMLVAVLLGGSALAVPALVAPGHAQDLAVADEAEITQELNEEQASEAFLEFDADVDEEALLPTQEELSEVLDNGEVDVSSYFAPRNRELVRELLERRTQALALEEEAETALGQAAVLEANARRAEAELRLREIMAQERLAELLAEVEMRRAEMDLRKMQADAERQQLENSLEIAELERRRELGLPPPREGNRGMDGSAGDGYHADYAEFDFDREQPRDQAESSGLADDELYIAAVRGVGGALTATVANGRGQVFLVNVGDTIGEERVSKITHSSVALTDGEGATRTISLLRGAQRR